MAALDGSLMTCSHLPASWWASAHERPSMSVRKRSASRWRRTTRSASLRPAGVSLIRLSSWTIAARPPSAGSSPNGGTAHLQPIGDARLDHRDIVFRQLEDALAVLLEGGVVLSGDGHGVMLPVVDRPPPTGFGPPRPAVRPPPPGRAAQPSSWKTRSMPVSSSSRRVLSVGLAIVTGEPVVSVARAFTARSARIPVESMKPTPPRSSVTGCGKGLNVSTSR